jgi:pimeloyl-ACP methyl ester carboxylesterase
MPVLTLPNGATVGYDDAGTGPPLVLLHAFPLDRAMWRAQLAELPDVARVIAPDLPGFGESSPSGAFTIESAADTVAAFVSALGLPKVALGGLSMGGYVALAFAREYPEKLSVLVLADTRAGIDDTNTRAGREKAIALVNAEGTAALFAGMLPKVLSEHTHATNPALVERLKLIAARQKPESVAAALAALRDRPDANPGLKSIAVPTLVLVGEHDAVTPPLSAANLAAQIRGSELVHVPRAGHLASAENPDAFSAAVRKFLTK